MGVALREVNKQAKKKTHRHIGVTKVNPGNWIRQGKFAIHRLKYIR